MDGTRERRLRAFTLVELVVVVSVIGIVTSFGAIGLASRVPSLKLKAQTRLVYQLCVAARERAMNESVTMKLRIYQTRLADDVAELYEEDTMQGWGTHQILYMAPVIAWHEDAQDLFYSTQVFPAPLLGTDYYDETTAFVVPLRPVFNAARLDPAYGHYPAASFPTALALFPTSVADLQLPGMVEMPSNVRILLVNNELVFTNGDTDPTHRYGLGNYTWPRPRVPNGQTVTGSPPRPPATYNQFDDRIVDLTYSPDGIFQFTPAQQTTGEDFTLTLATLNAASQYNTVTREFPDFLYDEYLTISIDRRSGVPRITQ